MAAAGATPAWPSDTSSVHVQIKGKGKFQPFELALLADGSLELLAAVVTNTAKKTGAGKRVADAFGCTVSQPKAARKGHPHSFRIDLVKPDSHGTAKYIVSMGDAAAVERWIALLTVYSNATREQYAADQASQPKSAPPHLSRLRSSERIESADSGMGPLSPPVERASASSMAKRIAMPAAPELLHDDPLHCD